MRGGRGPSSPGRREAPGLGAVLLAVFAIAGCGPGGDAAPPAPAAAPPAPAQAAAPAAPAAAPAPAGEGAAQREAEVVFSTRCSTCHGPRGEGDGPGAGALDPKPRNFHDPAWQRSVTDEHISQIIVGGGGAVGRSPLMPPNPDLAGKPEVVAALVVQIRSLGSR